MLKLLRLIRSN